MMLMSSFVRSGSILFVLALGITACAPNYDLTSLSPNPEATDTAETARSIYSDRTLFTYSSAHGTQITYLRPDGVSLLWYPGNFRAVPAQWKVEFDGPGRGHDICWKYPTRSYNPVTREFGGQFRCTPDRFFFPRVEQILQGDPSNLSSGRLPFVLPKARLSAEELAEQAKIPQSKIRTVFRD